MNGCLGCRRIRLFGFPTPFGFMRHGCRILAISVIARSCSPLLSPSSFFFSGSAGARTLSPCSHRLVVCLVAAVLAKLVFHACETQTILAFGIESPSGHVSFSATFYGCLALLVGAGAPALAEDRSIRRARLCSSFSSARAGSSLRRIRGPMSSRGWRSARFRCWCSRALRGPRAGRCRVVSRAHRPRRSRGRRSCSQSSCSSRAHWTPEPLIEAAGMRLGVMLNLCGPLS